jgi:hypothetical protein
MSVSDKLNSRWRSALEIMSIIEQQRTSSLTVAAFCQQHSLNIGTFHNWKKRSWSGDVSKNQEPAFVKLQFPDNLPALFAEVNGIRLFQPVGADFLKALLP